MLSAPRYIWLYVSFLIFHQLKKREEINAQSGLKYPVARKRAFWVKSFSDFIKRATKVTTWQSGVAVLLMITCVVTYFKQVFTVALLHCNLTLSCGYFSKVTPDLGRTTAAALRFQAIYSRNLTCSSINIWGHTSGSIVIALRTYRITFAHLWTHCNATLNLLWAVEGNGKPLVVGLYI